MSSFSLVVPTPIRKVKILAKDEVKSLDNTGYTEGFEAGYKAGLMQAEFEARQRHKRDAAQHAEEMRRVGLLQKELSEVHEELQRVVSSHLPQLVLAALSRVFQHHQFSNEEISGEVTSLLKELALAKSISIECSPDNLKALQAHIEGEGSSLCQTSIEWIANPDLGSGEYILRSDLGFLDGRRITRMAHVQTALKAIL